MAQQQQQPWQWEQALSDQRQCQHLAGSCAKRLERGCDSGGSIGSGSSSSSACIYGSGSI
jgi:hypothetical protein